MTTAVEIAKEEYPTIESRLFVDRVVAANDNIASIISVTFDDDIILESTEDESEDDAGKSKKIILEYENNELNAVYFIPVKYDYNKIWGYLGQFKTQNAFDSISEEREYATDSHEKRDGSILSVDAAKKCVWSLKYVSFNLNAAVAPSKNISSEDWERFRLMAKMSVHLPTLMMLYKAA